jgi:hypothetical protein
MQHISLPLQLLKALYGDDLGDFFLFVASPAVQKVLTIDNKEMCPAETLSWTGPESRIKLLERLGALAPLRCSILWITEDEFEHYERVQLANAKLAAISLFSDVRGVTSLPDVLDLVVQTNYASQAAMEGKLIKLILNAQSLRFCSADPKLDACFKHRMTKHWFSLHGPLRWSDQTVLPTGEFSVLTDASGNYSQASFPLDGEILLKGMPIVHRGSVASSPRSCEALFSELAHMVDHPVIARVEHGWIYELRSLQGETNPFLESLKRLFKQDDRYRKIQEIGLGTNSVCRRLRPYNFFANERYPGVHFGIGLGAHTSFHIDLVCIKTHVFADLPDGYSIEMITDADQSC